MILRLLRTYCMFVNNIKVIFIDMEIPAKYDPSQLEDKWYAYWLKNKFFHSEPDEREAYTIVIPPPNVTGILHLEGDA